MKNVISSFLQAKKDERSLLHKLISQTALLINLVVIVLLLIADSAKVVSPATLLLPSYLGLAFPLILAINSCFLLWWMFRRRWYIIFPLIATLVCWKSVKETFPIHFKKEITNSKTISVISYNVHLFDFFKKQSADMILKYLKESNADVLCIQEYGFSKKKEYLKEEDILATLKETFPYNHIDIGDIGTSRTFGVATFSKYPITARKKIKYTSKHNLSILTEILVDNQNINIINCHLESNKITENEKVLLKQLSSSPDNEIVKTTVSRLAQKLDPSYQLRASQAETVAKVVEQSKDPIILCGDFNDIAVSYAYNTIKGEKLISAFAKNGCGYDYTFSDKMFPFRIDHILYSKEFDSYNFKIDKVPYSDHYPVWCQFAWKGE